MPKKIKYSYEERIKICEDYLSGKRTPSQIAKDLGLKKLSGAIRSWIYQYQMSGPESLIPKAGYNSYSAEFKEMVVLEYYEKKLSIDCLAAKYNINNHTLSKWLSVYNGNKKFKDYHYRPEVYMPETGKKTTYGERMEAVEYCISHDYDYAGTAQCFDISYSQIYDWTQKYGKKGKEGLIDRRGHHKADDEVDELERLKRENRRLKRQLEEKDRVVELLKKAREFERM